MIEQAAAIGTLETKTVVVGSGRKIIGQRTLAGQT